ncbi:MAG TPA: gliding motility-associated C-terminal domain-containing protein [Hymenobacter sp.]|uniref:gliding motility-associated C-terminal domain-containing protein n=1 Tax=Hymenobacter sp. TaxID=1898978 RepID=UPI002D7E6787|nr:gliding motility-associated C-terminal domain-containing protein [Hymenobacter sp.]HET9503644.1 gliding motility-associated C-terminal domain-containing protein [Hymenobacter sp.]
MKIFFAFLGLLLATLSTHAQTACPTPPPAGCPQPFRVVDAGTGLEVTVLQVGCPVRFEQNCGRVTAPALLYYQVVKGTNAIPTNCLPTTTAGVVTYTPTAADVGPVTVFELSNPAPPSTAGGVAYIRNYTVVNPAPPAFTVAACAGNTALVTLTSPVYSAYAVQVNGGAAQPFTSSLTVGITPGGANTFVVTGNPGSSCPQSATQTVTLPVAQTPVFTRLTRTGTAAAGGAATLDFSQVPAGFTYALQLENPAAPGTYATVAGTTVAPAAGGNTATATLAAAQGRYRLLRTDACGNTAPSNSVSTLGLAGTAANGRNTLTFAPFAAADVTSYTLTRTPGNLSVPLPASATSYDDAAVQCGTAYTYRLTATLAGGGQTVSNTLALTAQSTTPPPAPMVVPSFDLTNYVVLTATPGTGAAFGPGGQVLISRQGGGGNFAFAPLRTGTAGLPRRVLRDSILSTLPTVAPCYSAVVRDTCGNTSPTGPSSCPALLSVTTTDPDGLTAQLSWTAFQGPGSPAAPVVYRVLTIAADGTVLAATGLFSSLTYIDIAPPTDRQILRYRVEARGGGLPVGTSSYSNVATLVRRPRLVMPTAFTPNGDGLNDVLELKGRYLQNFVFIVVDRNGQEVFRATDRTQTWDGTTKGRAPVNGAYVWRFDLTGEDNQPFRQTGTITILR